MRCRGSALCPLAMILSVAACGERASADEAPVAAAATVPSTPSTTEPSSPSTTLPAAVPHAAARPLAEVVARVPEGASAWVAIRDPFALIEGLAWATQGLRDAWSLLARAYAPSDLAELVAVAPELGARLGDSGVHLDRGVVLATLEGSTVVVLSADAADALPRLVHTISGHDTPLACDAVAKHADLYVCGSQAAARKAYRPRAPVELPAAFGEVAALAEVDGMAITVSARDAMLAVDLHTSNDAGTKPRVPTTMADLAAGSSLLWFADDPEGVASRVGATLPGMKVVTDAIRATTGEVLVSSPGGPLGLVVMTPVRTPAAMRRLVQRAPELAPQLERYLPGVKVTQEPRSVGGAEVDVAFVDATFDPALQAMLEQFELQSRAMLIASDAWAFAAFGLGESSINVLVGQPVGPAPAELLGGLPSDMAAALTGGHSALALHLEFDGLHGPDVRPHLLEAIGGELLLGDVERSTALLALMSAISSVSVWSEITGAEAKLRLVVRAFGDDQTEEGRAAHAARVKAEAGESPATAYGPVRDRYGASPRTHAYGARAGVGGLSTSYPAVANLLMMDALIRGVRRRNERDGGAGIWVR